MQYMREMYDQETDMMLDFIAESRVHIRSSRTDMVREQEALKDTQRSLCEYGGHVGLTR